MNYLSMLLLSLVLLCLCAAVSSAEQAKTVSLPMLIEQDPWTARCDDDGAIPGAQGFGEGYSGFNHAFTVGHRYRVSGRMGWNFLLTLDANGTPAVSDIHAGPYLAKAPVVKVDTEDREVKNAVEVIFGPVKEFTFQVPVDYLGWEILGAYDLRVGNRKVELPDGKWEMRGVLGWVIPLQVADGKVTVNGQVVGMDAKAVRCGDTGVQLAPLANANRVTLQVPVLLGSYTVKTLDGVTVLPAFTGPQTAALPPGRYRLEGNGVHTDLVVEQGTAMANLPTPQEPYLVAWPTGVAPCRAGTFPVAAPWGSETILLPNPQVGGTSLGLGWAKDNSSALLVGVATTKSGWDVKAKFVRGGGKDWVMTLRLVPVDVADPRVGTPISGRILDPRFIDLPLPADGGSFALPANLPVGAYRFEVTARPANTDKWSEDKTPVAAAIVPAGNAPAASLWFAMNRVVYRADEPVDLCTWQSADANGKYRALALAVVNGDGKTMQLGSVRNANGLYTIAAGALAPGDYQIALYEGPTAVAQRTVTITSDEPASHFPIHAYESVINRGLKDVDKLNSIGVNAFLDQAGVWLENEPRVKGMASDMAGLSAYLPQVGPASRYAPQGDRFLDYLDRIGWRFFAQWGSAHQPYGYGITFGDPTVAERLTMTSLWTSQYGRQHPSFLGMNVFDEGGTPRGPHFSDDGSYIEYENFKKKFGRAKPRYLGEDDEAARAWIYDKQDQHNFVYGSIGKRLEEINALGDPGSHLYLGTQNGNLNSMAVDGGHPPLAYKAITLSTFHWYPGYIQTAFILLGNEYHFMQPKPIEFWPLIWADGHFFLTRHEVNLAISRQVDGVGHFHWPDMLTAGTFTAKVGDDEAKAREEGLKALHARITRFGDLFRTVRRDRASEVAVLHSLYDIAPSLFPTKTDQWTGYNNAYKAAFTGYLVISSCLRKGIQAGWVSEEDILQRDGLAGRKVLIVPGITTMLPAVKQRIAAFIAAGGTVFVDGGTTVNLPGAKKLDVDFAAELAKAKFAQTASDGTVSNLNIDRVISDELLVALKPVEAVVGTHLQPGATDLLVTRQASGKASYYYCLNDRIMPLDQLPAPLSEYKVQRYHLPITTEVTLPGNGVVYDVFAGKEVARVAGKATVPVQLAEGEMALFAVLPEAIGRVSVEPVKGARPGEQAEYRVRVLGASGQVLDAAIPLVIQFTGADGKTVRPTIYRSTHAGIYNGEIHIGLFDPQKIHLAVKELMSGATAQLDFGVNAGSAVPRLAVEHKEAVIVENGKALTHFLSTVKRVVIALGDGEGAPDELAVAPLAAALRGRGISVEVRRASELARKSFDIYVGRGMYRMQAEVFAGSSAIPEIDAPVIAIGSSANNILIRTVTQDRNWTRYADRGFPGPGKAYVVHMWQPFSLTDDAVLAVAEDAAGVKQAVQWLRNQLR